LYGQLVISHWGVRDPAAFKGSPAETRAFFEEIHDQLATKIAAFVRLDMASLSPGEPSARPDEIAAIVVYARTPITNRC
jgi:hypothetical protein